MKTWNKRPNKGTSWAKYSRERVNFKKVNKKYQPPKKNDSSHGVYTVDPITWEVTYFTPQEWKKKEAELNKTRI